MEFKDNAKALIRLAGDNCKARASIEFFSWSAPAVDALVSIFCGETFADLGLEKVSSKQEVIHLVYYFYLRRLAEPGAIERLGGLEREGLVEPTVLIVGVSEESRMWAEQEPEPVSQQSQEH